MDFKHEYANSHCAQSDECYNGQMNLIQQERIAVGAITSYIWHDS